MQCVYICANRQWDDRRRLLCSCVTTKTNECHLRRDLGVIIFVLSQKSQLESRGDYFYHGYGHGERFAWRTDVRLCTTTACLRACSPTARSVTLWSCTRTVSAHMRRGTHYVLCFVLFLAHVITGNKPFFSAPVNDEASFKIDETNEGRLQLLVANDGIIIFLLILWNMSTEG